MLAHFSAYRVVVGPFLIAAYRHLGLLGRHHSWSTHVNTQPKANVAFQQKRGINDMKIAGFMISIRICPVCGYFLKPAKRCILRLSSLRQISLR